MRINLSVPYSEKDEAKALGAWWDAARKTWYVVDPENLMKFSRWMPIIAKPLKVKKSRHAPKLTKPSGGFVPLCQCDVLPWEDCEHTDLPLDEENILHIQSILT